MTGLLRKHLPDAVSWEQHRGSYADVESYVLSAYAAALNEFEGLLHDTSLGTELRSLVTHLCHPLPAKRAYGPPSVAGTALDMERVVSRLDYLSKRFAK